MRTSLRKHKNLVFWKKKRKHNKNTEEKDFENVLNENIESPLKY